MKIFTPLVNRVDSLLSRWRWNNVVPPMYGLYMILQGIFFLLTPGAFQKAAAYEDFFNLVPIWFWALLNIGIGVAVILRDTPGVLIVQSTVMIFESTNILIASIGDQKISPTAGVRGLILGVAFWILAIRMLMGDGKSYKNKD